MPLSSTLYVCVTGKVACHRFKTIPLRCINRILLSYTQEHQRNCGRVMLCSVILLSCVQRKHDFSMRVCRVLAHVLRGDIFISLNTLIMAIELWKENWRKNASKNLNWQICFDWSTVGGTVVAAIRRWRHQFIDESSLTMAHAINARIETFTHSINFVLAAIQGFPEYYIWLSNHGEGKHIAICSAVCFFASFESQSMEYVCESIFCLCKHW